MKPTVPPEPAPPAARIGRCPSCGLDPVGLNPVTGNCGACGFEVRHGHRAPLTLDPAALAKALEAIESYEMDWTVGADSNLARVQNIASRALTGTPAPAAAPPTVAPARTAREVAEEFIALTAKRLSLWWVSSRNDVAYVTVDALTKLLERDRASRSPGLKCEVCGSALARVEEQGVPVLPARYFCTGYRCLPSSPSVGQEGPSPAREGKEPESPALSGLDAATVEAAAKVADEMSRHVTRSPAEIESLKWCAARIRALATPPGQTKP